MDSLTLQSEVHMLAQRLLKARAQRAHEDKEIEEYIKKLDHRPQELRIKFDRYKIELGWSKEYELQTVKQQQDRDIQGLEASQVEGSRKTLDREYEKRVATIHEKYQNEEAKLDLGFRQQGLDLDASREQEHITREVTRASRWREDENVLKNAFFALVERVASNLEKGGIIIVDETAARNRDSLLGLEENQNAGGSPDALLPSLNASPNVIAMERRHSEAIASKIIAPHPEGNALASRIEFQDVRFTPKGSANARFDATKLSKDTDTGTSINNYRNFTALPRRHITTPLAAVSTGKRYEHAAVTSSSPVLNVRNVRNVSDAQEREPSTPKSGKSTSQVSRTVKSVPMESRRASSAHRRSSSNIEGVRRSSKRHKKEDASHADQDNEGFFSVKYISYDPGCPSGLPKTWQACSNSGIRLCISDLGQSLLPYDGVTNHSRSYHEFVVDDSWSSGAFYDIESSRIELFRPRAQNTKTIVDENIVPLSARLRIEFANQTEFRRFFSWCKTYIAHLGRGFEASEGLRTQPDFNREESNSLPRHREVIDNVPPPPTLESDSESGDESILRRKRND